jgi:hypothetical protein
MASVLRSHLSDVLERIGQRLALVLRWPAERVRLTDPDEVTTKNLPTQADQVCYYWPDLGSLDVFFGAGRLDTRLKVPITVAVFTRTRADEIGDAQRWLSLHLDVVGGVLDALVAFQPNDFAPDTNPDWDGAPDPSWLVAQPLVPAPVSKPRRNLRSLSGWGESRLTFAAYLIVPLDQAYQ